MEKNFSHSTPIRTLPLNMVCSLNINDSSIEVWRGSNAELVSTPESSCSPKRIRLCPKKEKKGKVTFNLPPAAKRLESDSDTDDYKEEPDTTGKESLLKPSQSMNAHQQKTAAVFLKDLNEPSEAELEALYRLDRDERDLHAPVGRGRGPHKPWSLRSKQPPVKVTREIPQ